MKTLFSAHIELSKKVMDMRLKRQNVVMSNLSNVTTPNYKERRLMFEEDLQAALGLDAKGKMTRTAGSHMPAEFAPNKFGAEWEKKIRPRMVWGEDNVDMEKEVNIMTKNTLMYNALSTVLKKNFEGLQKVIMEGSK